MDAFEFKKYNSTVATAKNLDELKEQMEKFRNSDPSLVNWHLEQGHIQKWLEYAGYRDAAEKLNGVKSVDEALRVLSSSATRSRSGGSGRGGQMGMGKGRKGSGPMKPGSQRK
ncbi:MAG: hypothetical protein ACP5NK_04835 [Thermoplasmata archaeon]